MFHDLAEAFRTGASAADVVGKLPAAEQGRFVATTNKAVAQCGMN